MPTRFRSVPSFKPSGPYAKLLSICKLVFVEVQERLVAQCRGRVRMVWPQLFFANGKGSLKQRLGQSEVELLLVAVQASQTPERDRNGGGVGPGRFLIGRNGLFVKCFCLGVFPLTLCNRSEIGQRPTIRATTWG